MVAQMVMPLFTRPLTTTMTCTCNCTLKDHYKMANAYALFDHLNWEASQVASLSLDPLHNRAGMQQQGENSKAQSKKVGYEGVNCESAMGGAERVTEEDIRTWSFSCPPHWQCKSPALQRQTHM